MDRSALPTNFQWEYKVVTYWPGRNYTAENYISPNFAIEGILNLHAKENWEFFKDMSILFNSDYKETVLIFRREKR